MNQSSCVKKGFSTCVEKPKPQFTLIKNPNYQENSLLIAGVGIQSHIDAIIAGEKVEDRVNIIRSSNYLTKEAKKRQEYFVKSFCFMAALTPYCGKIIKLTPKLALELCQSKENIKSGQVPGVRIDRYGDLVIEGRFINNGNFCADYNEQGFPLWPLIIRNAPVLGAGPCENFLPQALCILKEIGKKWPLTM